MTQPLANSELKWLLVDLDLTVAQNTGYPHYLLTQPVIGAKEALKTLKKKGWKVWIYTARPSGDYKLIEDWMKKFKIPFKGIINGKVLARWIIDDRAIQFKNNWDSIVEQIGKV